MMMRLSQDNMLLLLNNLKLTICVNMSDSGMRQIVEPQQPVRGGLCVAIRTPPPPLLTRIFCAYMCLVQLQQQTVS